MPGEVELWKDSYSVYVECEDREAPPSVRFDGALFNVEELSPSRIDAVRTGDSIRAAYVSSTGGTVRVSAADLEANGRRVVFEKFMEPGPPEIILLTLAFWFFIAVSPLFGIVACVLTIVR